MNDTLPEILQPLADPVRDGLARGWKVIDASSPGARSDARGGRRHRRYRRRRRHRRGNTGRCRTARADDRGRPAQVVNRLPDARGRRLSATCTRNRPRARPPTRRSTSCRGVASAAARRSTGRALPHARRDARALAIDARLVARRRRRSRAVVRSRRGAGSASRRGRSPRTPTTRRSRVAPQRSASTATSSAATSRAAGISATAGWDARPTRSSRCWSRRSRTRSMPARPSSRARARTDTSSAATTSKASNAWRWTQQERRRRHAGSPCAHARSSPRRARSASPALLLRSGVPDPHAIVGKRTFLHPTVVSAALMPARVDGFAGAPQTIYSDQFIDARAVDGPIGFKLEAPPVHPVLAAITLPGHGDAARARGCASCRTCRC